MGREPVDLEQRDSYGTDGGFIVFLSGNVQFFPNLGSFPFVRLSDGTPTINILEAFPNYVRVIGAGRGRCMA